MGTRIVMIACIVGMMAAYATAGKKDLVKKKSGKIPKDMVLISAGEFVMGSPEGEGGSDEHPRHRVYLDAFYIDKHEVTNALYENCVRAGLCKPQGLSRCFVWTQSAWKQGVTLPDESRGDGHPVICVDWSRAQTFCQWKGKRLPTEAEWEKAARGGSEGKWSFGDDESRLGGYAWYHGNSKDQTHPVGTKKPNQFGLYDMYGNVWEWVSDWYDENYYKNSPDNNPK